MSTTFASAYVLPSIAGTDPTYVKDVIAVGTGGRATWSTARREVPAQPAEVGDRRATATGGEATA